MCSKGEFMCSKGQFLYSQYQTKTDNIAGKAGSKLFSCSIYIEFVPKNMTMESDERICLVQAVQDKIKYHFLAERKIDAKVTKIEENVLSNITAGFEERLTENGWAIDQQLYNKAKEKINFDPRYVEERLCSSIDYRDHSDFSKKGVIGYAQNYKHGDSKLTTAILSDEPTAEYAWGAKKIPIGEEQFEVVAMLDRTDGTKEYIASFCWGWKLNKGVFSEDIYEPLLEMNSISVKDTPSPDFIEAAKKWNEMLLSNEITDEKFRLPI